MPWIGVSLTVPASAVAAVTEVLDDHGSLAVTARDASDAPIFEPDPGTTPLWQQTRIDALFDLDADLAGLRTALQTLKPQALDVHFIEDADFSSLWRTHVETISFNRRLWLAPRDAAVPDDGSPVLRLDPGLAFGTGAHPTTRLCLEWLSETSLAGKRVLDYGCGSGILALAALLLGAERVVAVDHDEQALVATRDNAAYNGLLNSQLDVGTPEMVAGDVFDIICANILAGALIELAPRLGRLVGDGGQLVLSGMLEDQADEVMRAYPGFRFLPPARRGDWVRLQGTKTGG